MIRYKITLEPDDNDTFLVTCPDLPGVVTFGESRADAIRHAVDAIETWIASLIADGLPVPRPKAAARAKLNEAFASLPALTTLKTELYWGLQDDLRFLKANPVFLTCAPGPCSLDRLHRSTAAARRQSWPSSRTRSRASSLRPPSR
jgi:predicted RNase H-like HicB family nuclease